MVKAKEYILLSLGLFLASLLYRSIFWQNLAVNGTHIVLNSLCDVFWGMFCGFLVLTKPLSASRNVFILKYVLLSALFSAALYYSHLGIYSQLNMLKDGFDSMFRAICFQFLDSISIVVLGSLSVIIVSQNLQQKQSEIEFSSLEKEKTKMELQYLKARMDPHFVFNGINLIYHELDIPQANPKESLLQFAEVLRYHLQYSGKDKIEFKDELSYIQSYLQFHEKRCQDFLEIECKIQHDGSEQLIEPMLILPLIENAIKYCRPKSGEKGKILVNIHNVAQKIYVHVENTIGKSLAPQHKGGFGLDNLQRRLQLIYPNKHALTPLKNDTTDSFTCTLELW